MAKSKPTLPVNPVVKPGGSQAGSGPFNQVPPTRWPQASEGTAGTQTGLLNAPPGPTITGLTSGPNKGKGI